MLHTTYLSIFCNNTKHWTGVKLHLTEFLDKPETHKTISDGLEDSLS